MHTRHSFFRVLFASALLLSAHTLPAQTLANIRELLHKRDFTAFQSYIDSVPVMPVEGRGPVRAHWQQLRDLTPSCQEGVVIISERITGRKQQLTHLIALLVSGNGIICYRLLEEDSLGEANEWKEPVDSFRSETGMAELKAAFQQVYGAPLDESDLFGSHPYGTACDADGAPPRMRYIQALLVEEKDIATLNNWLASANSEKQVYAVDGLYQLKQKGYILTAEQERLIGIIKNKRGTISVCRGCIRDNVPVRDILSGFVF
jgi:hypothetical protein